MFVVTKLGNSAKHTFCGSTTIETKYLSLPMGPLRQLRNETVVNAAELSKSLEIYVAFMFLPSYYHVYCLMPHVLRRIMSMAAMFLSRCLNVSGSTLSLCISALEIFFSLLSFVTKNIRCRKLFPEF